jgi:hypothetical protein
MVMNPQPRGRKVEPLIDQVGRAKARWLKRVMYESGATSSQKCFAYVIVDHLNCVTLDCWVGQPTVAKLLQWQSTKTVQRAATGLVALKLLAVRHADGQQGRWRCAPVFTASDWVNSDREAGQSSPSNRDTDVYESFLDIHLESSSKGPPRARCAHLPSPGRYKPSERGAIEIRVAASMGADGMRLLAELSCFDDLIVERLCRAHAEGTLTERELIAARLAAQQLGGRSKISAGPSGGGGDREYFAPRGRGSCASEK